MSIILTVTRHVARLWPKCIVPSNRRSAAKLEHRPRLLLLGIYVANQASHVGHLVEAFSNAHKIDVEQRWVGLKGPPPNAAVAAVTVQFLQEYRPKWSIVNDLIGNRDLAAFDYVAISDDDILVGNNFIDSFIAEQQSLDFALAQPARTWRSYTDHPIVRRRFFTRARQTNFVESGPFVSFRKDFLNAVFPFSLESPMGWGYDLTWPVHAQELRLKIGIVDGVPIDHSLRPRSKLYEMEDHIAAMASYLSSRPHIDLFRTLRVFR